MSPGLPRPAANGLWSWAAGPALQAQPRPGPAPQPAGQSREVSHPAAPGLQKPLRSRSGTAQAPLPAVPTQEAGGREQERGRLSVDRAGAKGEVCGGGGGPITASRGTGPLSGLSGKRAHTSQSSPRVFAWGSRRRAGPRASLASHTQTHRPPKLRTPLAPEEWGPSVSTHLPSPKSPPVHVGDNSVVPEQISSQAFPRCPLGPFPCATCGSSCWVPSCVPALYTPLLSSSRTLRGMSKTWLRHRCHMSHLPTAPQAGLTGPFPL